MNTTKKNKRNNNKGFTLGEIITTVAIIGTITSLALPNYLRMKMNTNEEMVRQQMRIVGEKMTEIMGKNGQFPDSEEWPNLVGNEDEISLTASLSAIDDLCYTNTDYTTNQSRSTYIFCSSPKLDACGRYAGKKRFCVHFDPVMSTQFSTGVVGDLSLADGRGMSMTAFQAIIDTSLTINDLDDNTILQAIERDAVGMLQTWSYWADQRENLTIDDEELLSLIENMGQNGNSLKDTAHPFSRAYLVPNDQLERFSAIVDQASTTFRALGAEMTSRQTNLDSLKLLSSPISISPENYLYLQNSNATLVEVGVTGSENTSWNTVMSFQHSNSEWYPEEFGNGYIGRGPLIELTDSGVSGIDG